MDTHLQSAISLLSLQLPCDGGGSGVRVFVLEGGKGSLTPSGGQCACKGVCKPTSIPGPETWRIHTPVYSFLGGKEGVVYGNRSSSIYTHGTKIIVCSDKHYINDIIRK